MHTKRAVLAADHENTEGVAATLTATNLVEVVAEQFPNPRFTRSGVERRLATGAPGRKPNIPGGHEGSIQVVMELCGPSTGNVFTQPPWSRFARSCGYHYELGKKQAVAASWTSGTQVSHGATFVADTTGATGRIIGTYQEGIDTFLVYCPISGTVDGTDTDLTVTYNGSTEAEVTMSSPGTLADVAAWYPGMTPISQKGITAVGSGPINYGDQLVGATSGTKAVCRNLDGVNGAATLKFSLHDPADVFGNAETINVTGGSATATTGSGDQQQTDFPTMTIGAFVDTQLRQLHGCRGTASLLLQNLRHGLWTFDMTGIPDDPTDTDILTWGGAKGAAPLKVQGNTFTLDNTISPRWNQVQYAFQNSISLREDPNQASGYRSAIFDDWDPQLTLDPEARAIAIWDDWAKQKDQTTFYSRQVIGPDAGGLTIEIRCPHAQLNDIDQSDRSGRVVNSYTANLVSGTSYNGADELVILMY